MKKCTRIDWNQYLPAGTNWRAEFERLGFFHGVCALISGIFPVKYFFAYLNLFEMDVATGKHVLLEGARMKSFFDLYNGCMVGFAVLALSMFFLAALHYASHYTPTKSIYVMRRLPSKWEMAKRVWTIPLLTMLASLVFAAVLTLLYIAIYFLFTPAVCLPNNPF